MYQHHPLNHPLYPEWGGPYLIIRTVRDFPGCSVVKTPCFHAGEHRFDPWEGAKIPCHSVLETKKQRNVISLPRVSKLVGISLAEFCLTRLISFECTAYNKASFTLAEAVLEWGHWLFRSLLCVAWCMSLGRRGARKVIKRA